MRARDRRIGLRALLVLALVLSLPAHSGRAEDEEEERRDVPVDIKASVDAKEAAATGMVTLRLEFIPLEDIDRPYGLQVRLMAWRRTAATLDHTPEPPVGAWRKGKPVTYEVPVSLPLTIKAKAPMGFFVGFHDPKDDIVLPPRAEGPRYMNRVRVADFEMPDFGPLEDGPMVQSILAAAEDLAAKGREADAWSALELGIRRAIEDGSKYRFRDAVLGMGDVPPRPISIVERDIVAARIEGERRRYLRQISGRCFDRKQYHAALRILESIGGKLSEAADAAVIGALDQATRTKRDIDDLKVRILRDTSDDDKAAVEKAVKANGYAAGLYEKAEGWFQKKRYAAASLALRTLGLNTPDAKLSRRAAALREKVDAARLADTPPAEQGIVERAVNHPVWARTKAAASHKFIYIGPERLVSTIPKRSQLRFDLAYVFLTNLFGRVPNPGGDRVTVYFKELWDFGGGVGGGKIINIGRAKPDHEGRRIDNGLLYHELTHCIDDTNPIIKGWREGLANMGAAYAYEALGQSGDSLHSFQANLRAFQQDYLDRDLAYWRMQNYGPSAGFFLHFVEKHSKAGNRHDWKPYRRFFREYRSAPVRDGRTPYVARAVAYFLIRAFGPKAFDDLLRFRLPLNADDRDAVKTEMEAFASGGYAVERAAPELEKHHGSPIPRDVIAGKMMQSFRSGHHEEAERISREELGVIHEWRVIGPFKQKGVDPGAGIFPPEHEIDYAKEYPGEANVAKWREPKHTGVVERNATGWVKFNFAYQDNTATYALSFLTVPTETNAFLHVRADDDVTIFLNDRLVENYIHRGMNASTLVAWRGPYAPVPDAMKLGVTLRQGRNKLLVKVRNRRGDAGFILAVAQPRGLPVAGMTVDTRDPAAQGSTSNDTQGRSRTEKRILWKSVLKMNFARKSFGSKLETTVGKFKSVNKALTGQDTDKRVGWRKYTVRPGFPKDSPSNLIWIKSKYTADLEDFRLALDCRSGLKNAPKLVVTIQGNGKKDALSGWNLIVHPRGKGMVGAQIERYDHLYYQVPPVKIPDADVRRLEIVYLDGKLTVKLADVVLFRDVSITPIRGRHRIGIATYGPKLGIEKLELHKHTPKR